MAFLSDCRPATKQSGSRRNFARRVGVAFLWLRGVAFASVATIALFQSSAVAQRAPSKEEIEAAFLYNFAKFVEWPTNAFATASSPIVIGVLGNKDFAAIVDKTVRTSQPVNGRTFKVESYESSTEIHSGRECHILFINCNTGGTSSEAKREMERLRKIITSLEGKSILTVSEDPGNEFAKLGGIVNFYTENQKIRFQINPDAAKAANLKISSKLLNLAQIVRS